MLYGARDSGDAACYKKSAPTALKNARLGGAGGADITVAEKRAVGVQCRQRERKETSAMENVTYEQALTVMSDGGAPA